MTVTLLLYAYRYSERKIDYIQIGTESSFSFGQLIIFRPLLKYKPQPQKIRMSVMSLSLPTSSITWLIWFHENVCIFSLQEYMAEGIPVDLVEFTDNRPVLDMLLSRPLGLLALLDEESRFPRSNDKSLIG